MNVISLFDGMGCGAQALKNNGVDFNYYTSEIDEQASKVSCYHHRQVKLGDITNIKYENGCISNGEVCIPVKFDLLFGGSPCQSISGLGDGSGLDGKSSLFFHWLRLRNEIQPKWWLLENVCGNKDAIKTISDLVGVEPIKICSSDFSAQTRSRLYWTNIPVDEWEKKDISLIDILDASPCPKETTLTESRMRWLMEGKGVECRRKRYASLDRHKAACLTARSDASWNCNYVTTDGVVRKLSVSEYEKLQTLPVGYTNVEGVKTTEKYKMIGNGWTVDVIAHLLKNIR